MNEQTTSDTGGRSIWMRALFMLLFAIIYSIAEIVVFFVAVFQFFCVLIAKTPNVRLLALGTDLSTYIYRILQFMTFNTEHLPFPFDAWPGSKEEGA